MNNWTRNFPYFLGLSLALTGTVRGQELDADPERRSLTRLSTFAVDAQVHVSKRATLDSIDEGLLRARMESAMRREGISVQGSGDVRDGSQAQVRLVYLVLETGDDAGGQTGFAASSCLEATQLVTIPRLSRGRITYVVAPTWSSCGMVVGTRESFRGSILHNADEQIARFLSDWRRVNPARSTPPAIGNAELGWADGRTDGRTEIKHVPCPPVQVRLSAGGTISLFRSFRPRPRRDRTPAAASPPGSSRE